MSQVALTALCFQMPQFVQGVETDSDVQWLPMIPAGTAEGRDGRKWFNNNPDAIVAAFESKLPFDIEHSTEIKGPKGEDADAYGWIIQLENRNGEIWAGVEWNDNGVYKIKRQALRLLLSCVFLRRQIKHHCNEQCWTNKQTELSSSRLKPF